MKRHAERRAGLTLLELIVVIGIIALLAALTAGAVFRYQESSKVGDTNRHVLKLYMGLERQWKAATDGIKNEPIPQQIRDFTMNADGTYNNARAKALYMKLRLRQEFPQNFDEARTPAVILLPNGQQYVFEAKPYFRNAIKNARGPSPEMESAALLVLILSHGRGGVAFDVEGAAPIQTVEFDLVAMPGFPNPPAGAKLPLRVCIDSWSWPIAFRRAAPDNAADVLVELNQPPFVSPTQISSGNMDPDDPEGQLRPKPASPSTDWVPQFRAAARLFFATAPLADPFGEGQLVFLNRGPFVYSAGRDRVYLSENDLYSFRLQSTGRGN